MCRQLAALLRLESQSGLPGEQLQVTVLQVRVL